MKKQDSYKKPNWLVYFIYRMISKFIAKFVFNTHINRNELKKVKGPYVVIANHESSIDFINVAAFIKRRVHFVISKSFYNTLPIRGLLKLVGVIPKQQFQTSVVDIKKMKQVIENDMPLVIYPVGLMSENGASDPVPNSTSKFLKMMNIDVYVCRTKGSYLTKPKWSKVRRKGRIDIDIYKLFSKEQLGQLSNDEIYDLIEKNLSYDAYKNNEVDKVKFKNGDNLKGLEYVLFRCPHCHKEKSIISNNDTTLVCKDCGYSVKGNEYGLLESLNNSKIYFTSPSEWYFSIYDYYKNKILLGEEILLENEVDILMINYKKKKYELVGKGKVCLNKDKIILTGDVNKEFNITNYPYLPFIPGRHLDLQDGQDIYRLDFKEKYDVTKFVMLVKIYHNLIK
jgi:ribosomal protein S27E